MPLARRKRVEGWCLIGACLADFVAKSRLDFVDWRVVLIRHPSRHPSRHPRQDTKKPASQQGEAGVLLLLGVARLANRLTPRVNRRASVRSVLQGRARRWYIVMPMSARRYIARYI